jgi:hypothetical protein
VTPSIYDRDNATVTNAIQGDWRKEANNFENLQSLTFQDRASYI